MADAYPVWREDVEYRKLGLAQVEPLWIITPELAVREVDTSLLAVLHLVAVVVDVVPVAFAARKAADLGLGAPLADMNTAVCAFGALQAPISVWAEMKADASALVPTKTSSMTSIPSPSRPNQYRIVTPYIVDRTIILYNAYAVW
jgi:hypothetical protein